MAFTGNGKDDHVTYFSRRFLCLPFALCRSHHGGKLFHVNEKNVSKKFITLSC